MILKFLRKITYHHQKIQIDEYGDENRMLPLLKSIIYT